MNMVFCLSLRDLQSNRRQESHEMLWDNHRQTDGRHKDIWGLADQSNELYLEN